MTKAKTDMPVAQQTTTLAAIQMVSSPDIIENLATISEQIAQLRQAQPIGEMLVVLPECCLVFAASDHAVNALAEPRGQGPMQQALCELAEQFNVYLVAGTIALKAPDGRNFAASLLISPSGEVLAQYNKIHLFDVDVSDGIGQYRESDGTHPGEDVVVVDTPIGRIGMAVCYDLRFSALFNALASQQTDIMVLPSAFTKPTGRAHWELLLRARAIESQCFIVGANQGGCHVNGRETWGHSMIVNPWGEVVAQMLDGVGYVQAQYLPQKINETRRNMPMASQQRFSASKLKI